MHAELSTHHATTSRRLRHNAPLTLLALVAFAAAGCQGSLGHAHPAQQPAATAAQPVSESTTPPTDPHSGNRLPATEYQQRLSRLHAGQSDAPQAPQPAPRF